MTRLEVIDLLKDSIAEHVGVDELDEETYLNIFRDLDNLGLFSYDDNNEIKTFDMPYCGAV